MSEAGATIKIDADTTSAVTKVKRLGDEVKKVGSNANNVDFGKAVGGLGKMLATSGAILKVATAIADAYTNAANKAGSASRTGGGSRLAQDQAAAKLGLGSARATALIEGTVGGGTLDSRRALLSSLGGVDGIGANTAAQALGIGATGVIGNDEILKSAKDGTLGQLRSGIGERFNRMSPQAQQELRLRAKEQQAAVALERAGDTSFAQSARISDSNRDVARADSPFSAAVGDIGKAVPGAGAVSDAFQAGSFQGMAVEELRAIRQNTGGKLNLSARGENSQ